MQVNKKLKDSIEEKTKSPRQYKDFTRVQKLSLQAFKNVQERREKAKSKESKPQDDK